jgi:hypothetical protein
VIIDNLDVECVALSEFETDPPRTINGHRPLRFPEKLATAYLMPVFAAACDGK